MLNVGAVSSSEDSEESDETNDEKRRKSNVSESLGRTIDRLIKSTYDPSIAEDKQPRVIDENGKIKFDRLQYDLDIFKSILTRVEGFDYKTLKSSYKAPETFEDGIAYDDLLSPA
jgi:hypothetical protein